MLQSTRYNSARSPGQRCGSVSGAGRSTVQVGQQCGEAGNRLVEAIHIVHRRFLGRGKIAVAIKKLVGHPQEDLHCIHRTLWLGGIASITCPEGIWSGPDGLAPEQIHADEVPVWVSYPGILPIKPGRTPPLVTIGVDQDV